MTPVAYTGVATLQGIILAAAPADPGFNWTTELIRGGPFALILILILFDKLGTNSERDRLRQENQQLREANAELNKEVRDEVVPVLTEANSSMARVVDLLADEERFPRRRPR